MRGNGEQANALAARMADLCERAERGEVAASVFLSPREAHEAAALLRRQGRTHVAFGGYGDAERTKIYVLPDYMEDEEAPITSENLSARLADYGMDDGLAVLRVTGSGYETLSHRAYLGSLLGLGLERDVLGDLVVLGERGTEAYVFCDGRIAPFLLSEWTKVGRDTVRVAACRREDVTVPPRRTEPWNDTVASPRLDAVVASLCRLSREKAHTAVTGGLVEVDFALRDRPDFFLQAPCLVSVRGFGRYRILSLSEETKKGRLRLVAERFV